MMKFLVDSLPYYGELCPFWISELCYPTGNECTRHWSKYQVTSEYNPHECEWLKEIGNNDNK